MTEARILSLGYSPCPNDTYIFNGLVHGKIPLPLVQFAPPVLDDVETLNTWAMQSRLDVTKLSFHALGHVLDRYQLLDTGAALGRGCGPLLITSKGQGGLIQDWRIAIPGAYTTAALLLRLFCPDCRHLTVLRFDQIMAAIASGEVDAGVIIHESRFTYQQYGLQCVQDLGAWWEETTGLPIPLGCIAASRSLSPEVCAAINAAIRASIEWADTHHEAGWAYIRDHARELEPEVIRSHIALYVNRFSAGLGEEGRAAIRELFRRAGDIGLFPYVPDLI